MWEVLTQSVMKRKSLRREQISVSTFATGSRRVIGSALMTLQNLPPADPIHGNVEMDTHADTCVLGKNFIVLEYTGKECDVSPYPSSYSSIKNVPIVSGVTAYRDPESLEVTLLVFHQALWMRDSLDHTLVNPNQVRWNGGTVKDDPFSGPMYMEDVENQVRIPMQMIGTNVVLLISYALFHTSL